MDRRQLDRSPGWMRKANIVLLTVLLALWVQQFSSLLMKITGRASYIVDAAVVLLLAAMTAALIGSAVRRELTPLRFFLTMAIPLGLVYLLLFPPWGAPDSVTHYLASYRVSNLLMMQGEAGAWMGRSEDVMVLNGIWPLHPTAAPNPKSSDYAALLDELYLLTGSGNLMALPHADHMALYSALNYLPQAAGLTIGRLLGLGSVLTTELGRLMMLVVYVALGAWAVRIAPVGKSVFALVPMLPPCLMLGTSFSFDGVLIPVTMCYFAGILRLSLGEGRGRELLFCLVMAFLLGAVKGGASFLLLLPLPVLLLTEARGQRGKRAGMLLLIIAAGVASTALFDLLLPGGLSLLGTEGGGTYSAALVREEPLTYLSMAFCSYARGASRLIAEMGGRAMGWMEKVNPKWLAYALLAMVLLSGLVEKDSVRLRKRDIWLLLIASALSVLLIPVMLLANTPLTEKEILGLQGRYFLPVLPVMLFIIAKFHLYELVYGAEARRDEWETIGQNGSVRVNRATGEVRPAESENAERPSDLQAAAYSAGTVVQAVYQVFAALSVCVVWELMCCYLTR